MREIIIKIPYCGCFRIINPKRPKKVSVKEKVELPMDRFGFVLALPPVDPDTESIELTVTTNGVEPPQVLTFLKTATQTEQLIFNQDDTFVAVVVAIDDAGNRSQPSAALTVVVNDDVPPPQPNSLSVANKVELPEVPPVV